MVFVDGRNPILKRKGKESMVLSRGLPGLAWCGMEATQCSVKKRYLQHL